jgi:flagellin-like hook-associated protein FlgL
MSAIPSNLSRVPNLLVTGSIQSQITRANLDLLQTQNQLASGRRILNPSDDPIASSLNSVLTDRLRASEQRSRNLDHASSTLSTIDSTLGELSDLALQAKSIGSSQIGVGSDAETRAAEANVIESIIREVVSLSNTRFADLYVFGGERTGRPPIESFFQGYRYRGAGEGLLTDLGSGLDAPITIGADAALGALSSRLEGSVDLDPEATRATRLEDLGGARGLGASRGLIEVEIDPGGPTTTVQVDLSEAETIDDVADAIESAIRGADPAALTGVFPGAVDLNATGRALEFGVSAGYTITVRDVGEGTTAADLGLTSTSYDSVITTSADDLDPRLTEFTTFGELNPPTPVVAGDIVFRNGGRTGTVSVTGGMTIGAFARAVEGLGLGLRVEINEDGRRLNVINEVAGMEMAVEESGGGTLTASSLGIRTLQADTPLSVFNHGRGVEIADGAIDPVTGLADPDRNVDFEVGLTDGSTFTVDLRPQDLANVGALLSRMNAEAAAAGYTIGTGAGEIQFALADGGNGIALFDNLGGAQAVSVTSLNGHAAEDLGLLDGVFAPGAPATFAGEDRASVRVEGLLGSLIALRDALSTNDERGITFASERLEEDVDRLATARAVAGGRASRVEASAAREEDGRVLDQTIRSSLVDLDYAEASGRFSLQSLVLQAGYRSAGTASGLTLLDFLR